MIKRIYNFVDRKLGFRELVRYGLVGVIGAAIDFSLLNVFVQFTKFDVYQSLVFAFLISVIASYFLHSYWTFKVKNLPIKLIAYCLTALVGLIINFTVMYLLIEGWEWWYNYAKLAALFVALVWNYTIAKTLVFNNINR
jgi:putative flippase GtrA